MRQRALDIIVPVYRNASLVRATVDSILAHLPEIKGAEPRLIIINDSPGDVAVELLLEAYRKQGNPALELIRNPRNVGFVQSVNAGLRLAQRAGRNALIVNSDTVTFPGTLAEILRVAKADPQIGFVSPRSNNASICSLPHFHGGTLATPEEAHRLWRTISRTLPEFHFAPTAVGFYMYIAYVVLANHGGLSEDFGVGYEEENDLVLRAGKQGFRAVIANHAFAYHAGSASFALTGIDLSDHRTRNLKKVMERHPEFIPLVQRYQASAHCRAERLMAGLIPDGMGRTRVVFDLSGLGTHYNGTNEHAVAVVRSLVARWSTRLRIAGMGSPESFRFHGLDKLAALARVDPGAPGLHAVSVRIAQPFDLHDLNVLEGTAPINVFAMLDTIAEDCGPLAVKTNLTQLWDHVARHANGLLFNSKFSELTFTTRHPDARTLPRVAALLPTRLSCYGKQSNAEGGLYILVLGNHFPHKGADQAARQIAAAYPTLNVVVLGADVFEHGNLTGLRSGTLDPVQMDRLFTEASVVVLPSYIEGFGLGLMHALAAGRAIVARRIPATEEILLTLDKVEGVHLFDNNMELVPAVGAALSSKHSSADDSRGGTWDDWADAVASLCLELTQARDVFTRAARRIEAGDLLRKSALADQSQRTGAAAEVLGVPSSTSLAQAMDLRAVLSLDGREFLHHAYLAVLQRPPDGPGLDFYLGQLAAGTEKEQILRILAASPEGKSRGADLQGLPELFAESSGK